MTAEIVLQEDARPIDLAISVWLDAKTGRTGSVKTARAYHDTLRSFREFVQQTARCDLDGMPSGSVPGERSAEQAVTMLAVLAQRWAGLNAPGAATYNQRLSIVSSFYGTSRKKGLVAIDNPIDRVDRRRVEQYGGARPLAPEVVKASLQAIDRTTLQGARDYAILVVALQCGRRLSELVALRLHDIEQGGATVLLRWRHCKGGKQMSDTLPRGVANALLNYVQMAYPGGVANAPKDAPVWISLSRNSYGKPLDRQSFGDICQRHLGTSKVHALRHTFAKVMEDAGAKVTTIQQRLGHESLHTTGIYLNKLNAAHNTHANDLAVAFGIDGDE